MCVCVCVCVYVCVCVCMCACVCACVCGLAHLVCLQERKNILTNVRELNSIENTTYYHGPQIAPSPQYLPIKLTSYQSLTIRLPTK